MTSNSSDQRWEEYRVRGEDLLAKVHLGSRLTEDTVYSQRTYELDTQTMISALGDVTERAFDRAKVEAIKQALRDGSYPLDPRRIAESFVAIERMIGE